MDPAGSYQILKFISALVFVIALMLLLGWGLRRMGISGAAPLPGGKRRRLGLVEQMPVDHKRRLLLIRRDDVEHLILMSPGGETVVETGIVPPEGAHDRLGEAIEEQKDEAA